MARRKQRAPKRAPGMPSIHLFTSANVMYVMQGFPKFGGFTAI